MSFTVSPAPPPLPRNWKAGFTAPHHVPRHEEPFIECGVWKVYCIETMPDGFPRTVKYNFRTDLFEEST